MKRESSYIEDGKLHCKCGNIQEDEPTIINDGDEIHLCNKCGEESFFPDHFP